MPGQLADRKRWPMIAGFSYSQQRAGEFYYRLLKQFKFEDVAALYDFDDAVWRAMFTAMNYMKARPDIRLEEVKLEKLAVEGPIRSEAIRGGIMQAHRTARGTPQFGAFLSP